MFWTLSLTVCSQSILDVKLDGSERGKKLVEFLEEFEQTHEVRFYFVEDWLSAYTIEGDYAGQSLEGMLKDLLRDSRITYASIQTNGIVFIKDPTYEMERRNALITAARRQSKVDRRVIGALENYKPGIMVSLRGRITHEDTKAPVAGATIQVGQSIGGTSTDNSGMFELKIPTGEHVVTIAFVSLKERVVDLTVYEGGELNLAMQEAAVLLQEVVVNSLPISELTNSRAGQLQLSVGAMKKQPTLMGEADLVRQLQSLPGVSTTGEAASGFNVRGGSVDQNLVLYDGMPVFNTSHSLGFFSAFYSEAIREMTFYRGGIPAEYGGRASSVLDIRSQGGDPEKWRGSGGIGSRRHAHAGAVPHPVHG